MKWNYVDEEAFWAYLNKEPKWPLEMTFYQRRNKEVGGPWTKDCLEPISLISLQSLPYTYSSSTPTNTYTVMLNKHLKKVTQLVFIRL